MPTKKEKIKAKKAKLEAKLKGAPVKAAKALAVALALGLLAGCQTADPASRSNRTQYRDIVAKIEGSSNTVTISVGDGLYASADGGGDAQHNTPTQTTDTKPEVAVGVGGGSAGTGGAATTAGLTDKIMAALKSLGLVGAENESAVSNAVSTACADGSCADSAATK